MEERKRLLTNKFKMLTKKQIKRTHTLIALFVCLSIGSIYAANEQQPLRPWLKSRGLLSRSVSASTPQPSTSSSSSTSAPPQQQSQAQSKPQQQGTGSAVEVAPPVNLPAPTATNRSTRTADVFQNGDGYNIFVTNTCERESMKVNIRTSRPFYGVIHTKDQRDKPICSVEGDGGTEYSLDISHVLNSRDPAYCGVIKARRESPEDKDVLSAVVAVRVHRTIELSDDKFFLLNCTNRCRKADCSSPAAKLLDEPGRPNTNGRLTEEETERETERVTPATNANRKNAPEEECTIWKFPWAITLLWCLGILLLAMIISHCIMCSSMMCRCVKTEVEETEPEVFEGATDCEDDGYNKRHPYRIDYDNKDIYKTSNNYAPYNLEEAQTKSRQKHRRSGK